MLRIFAGQVACSTLFRKLVIFLSLAHDSHALII